MRWLLIGVGWGALVVTGGVAGMLAGAGGATGMDSVGWALLILVGVAYPIPALIAAARGHPNVIAISVVDLVLGWTVIGWLGALAWSFGHRKPPMQMAPVDTPRKGLR